VIVRAFSFARCSATAFALIALSSCALFQHGPDPFGQPWHAPYRQPLITDTATLGFQLEKTFDVMLAQCNITAIDSRSRTALPNILQLNLESDLNRPVISTSGESSWNLFRFVFSEADLSRYYSEDQRDYLDQSLIGGLDLPVPAPGSRSIIYRHTCGSIADAAAKANLKVPEVDLKAALAVDYEEHTELALVLGRFYSPLSQLLSAETPLIIRERTMLGIWNWYRDQQGYDPTQRPACYLTGFSGVAVYSILVAARSVNGSLEGNFSVAAPIGGLESSFKAALTGSDSTSIHDYTTHIFETLLSAGERATRAKRRTSLGCAPQYAASDTVQDEAQFAPLPLPVEIANSLWSVSPTPVRDTTVAASADTANEPEVALGYLLPWLPKPLCVSEQWKSEKDDPAHVTGVAMVYRGLDSAEKVRAAQDTACVAVLQYTPRSDSALQMVQFYTLDSVKTKTIPLPGATAQDTTLHLFIEFPVKVKLPPKAGANDTGTKSKASGIGNPDAPKPVVPPSGKGKSMSGKVGTGQPTGNSTH
jgi:hypothetical protein